MLQRYSILPVRVCALVAYDTLLAPIVGQQITVAEDGPDAAENQIDRDLGGTFDAD